jgi:hypothetical protein
MYTAKAAAVVTWHSGRRRRRRWLQVAGRMRAGCSRLQQRCRHDWHEWHGWHHHHGRRYPCRLPYQCIGGVDRCAVSVTTAPAAATRNWAGCPSAAMSCHSAAALRPTLVDLSAVRRLESTCLRRDWLVAQGRIAPGRSGSMADPPRRQRAQDPGERGPCTRRRAGAGAGAHAVALLVPLTPIMPCPGWCSHPAARRDACQMTAVALAGRR